jgi:hypothetical protein
VSEGPKQFRRKPIIIEAMCLRKGWAGAQKVIDWVNKETSFDPKTGHNFPIMYYYGDMTVKTLEGDMHAKAGDWIVKGVKGEFWVCKPRIFRETYEKVSGTE